MKKFWLFLFLILVISSYANQNEFIVLLSEKKEASFEDAVISFCYLYNIEIKNAFEENVENLKRYIKIFPKRYEKEKKLTVSDFSLLAIQYLNIKSGLFYLITKNGRYASRELMLINIIPFNKSEWDIISGIELIKLLQKVDEYASKKSK